MKLPAFHLPGHQPKNRAFTLVELMFSTAIGVVVIAAFALYIKLEAPFVSSITQQATMNNQAANALEIIQSRVRLATLLSNDTMGMTLTLGFDDSPNLSSNDNQTHFEWFEVLTTTGQDGVATNRLVYITTNAVAQTYSWWWYTWTNVVGSSNIQVLVPSGVCTQLNSPYPGYFFVTNFAFVDINFGVVDLNSNDYPQSVSIQGRAVSLNRMRATNQITFLPVQ